MSQRLAGKMPERLMPEGNAATAVPADWCACNSATQSSDDELSTVLTERGANEKRGQDRGGDRPRCREQGRLIGGLWSAGPEWEVQGVPRLQRD